MYRLFSRWTLIGVVLSLAPSTLVEAEEQKPQHPHQDPLPPVAISRIGTARLSHGSDVTELVFSHDGKRLVSCSRDFTVRTWDVPSGRELLTIPTDFARMTDVAVSSSAKLLAAASEKRGVWLWDAETGKELHHFDNLHRMVAFSPDGKLLLTAAMEGDIYTWDVKTRKQVEGIAHRHPTMSLQFSRSGKWLATSSNGSLLLWDWKKQELIHSLTSKVKDAKFGNIAFSHNEEILAATDHTGAVNVWETETGKLRSSQGIPRDPAISLAASNDAKHIYTGHADGSLRVWNSAGDTVGEYAAHARTSAIALSPDGKTLATGGFRKPPRYDYSIKLWNADPANLRVIVKGGAPTTGMTITSGRSHVAVAHADGSVLVWDGKSRDVQHRYSVAEAAINARVTYSPDGERLAITAKQHLLVHDAKSGKQLAEMRSRRGAYCSVVFADGGKLVIAGCTLGWISIWETTTGRLVKQFHAHKGAAGLGDVAALAVSPNGKRFASCGFDSHVAVWDAATGASLGRWKTHPFLVRAVAFSPDGTRLASGGAKHQIVILEIATGEVIREIDSGWSITSLGFCDGGRTLVTGHHHDRIKFWDLATGKMFHEMRRPGASVTSIQMRRRMKSMFTSLSDSTVIEWDLKPVLAKLPTQPAFKLTRDRENALWKTLAAADAGAADKAIWEIVAAGEAGATMLVKKLRAEPAKLDMAIIDKLIRELDDDEFAARESAEKELRSYGAAVIPRLERELKNTDSAEVRFRVDRLLVHLRKPVTDVSPERLQANRAIYALSAADTPAARQALSAIAKDDAIGNPLVAAHARLVLRGESGPDSE